MNEVTLRICGTPPESYGTSEEPYRTRQREWREKLANCGRNQERVQTDENTEFNVEIAFYLRDEHWGQDLDNLAKPVLETLFRLDQRQNPDQVGFAEIFLVDDKQVVRLVLEKKRVRTQAEEGTTITVSWNR